jgi:hypothetical protein
MGMMIFGIEEDISCIQDVPLRGPDGEELCLAYKTTIKYIIAGVYLRDDGHVLKIQGSDAYYPVPTGSELPALQQAGLLPQPLPSYSIPTMKYVDGYFLWIALAFAVAVVSIGQLRSRPREE